MIIAQTTVYSCDGTECDSIYVAKGDMEIERFTEVWFAGADLDFCPKCKDKPEHAHAIAQERRRIAEMDGDGPEQSSREVPYTVDDHKHKEIRGH